MILIIINWIVKRYLFIILYKLIKFEWAKKKIKTNTKIKLKTNLKPFKTNKRINKKKS